MGDYKDLSGDIFFPNKSYMLLGKPFSKIQL